MKRLLLFIVGIVVGTNSAIANSYLEMITTPPEAYVVENAVVQEVKTAPLWYDYRIETSSPVVTSSLPKYLAWQRAKAYENDFNYTHNDVQNMIYFLSGAAMARLAYDIWGPYHRHHLLK
ncbi:MAG: hypothetical protein NC218_08660 [Acetobacter sp.]|nr:hypothetical protein [Acetobacter sp.]